MASEQNYKYVPRPDNASTMSPSDARALFRRNGYYGTTAGFCLGYAQTNVIILPKEFSVDFEEFCKRNSGPLPLLYRSEAGEVGAPPLATDSNIRFVPLQWCIKNCMVDILVAVSSIFSRQVYQGG